MIEVLPTDAVVAPAERIWELFVEPEALRNWWGGAAGGGARAPHGSRRSDRPREMVPPDRLGRARPGATLQVVWVDPDRVRDSQVPDIPVLDQRVDRGGADREALGHSRTVRNRTTPLNFGPPVVRLAAPATTEAGAAG